MHAPDEQPEDFLDTHPLREHQERLHVQWGRPRAHYAPNHVNAGTRVLLALLSATWVSWALIGLLSGHMFLFALILPLHLTGWAAMVFSVAVLVSAAACCVSVVDHYDRRDNERSYQRARRRLWRLAGAIGVIALALQAAEHFDLVPASSPELGLLSVEGLQNVLHADWLQRWLADHHDGIHTWWWVTALWCALGLTVFKKLGLLEVQAHDPHTHGGLLIACMSMLIPAGVTFSLFLLDALTLGHLANEAESPAELRQLTAWMQTMLLATVSATAFFSAVSVMSVLRQLGWMAPPDQPPAA